MRSVSWNDFGMGTPNGDETLAFMEAEVAKGNEIYAVARCQRAETRFTLKKLSAVFASSEHWVDLSKLDPADKIAALSDPDWRARLSEFWATAKFMANTSVEKGSTPETIALEGRLLDDIAAERGVSRRGRHVRHRHRRSTSRRSSGSRDRSTSTNRASNAS